LATEWAVIEVSGRGTPPRVRSNRLDEEWAVARTLGWQNFALRFWAASLTENSDAGSELSLRFSEGSVNAQQALS